MREIRKRFDWNGYDIKPVNLARPASVPVNGGRTQFQRQVWKIVAPNGQWMLAGSRPEAIRAAMRMKNQQVEDYYSDYPCTFQEA